MIASLIIEKYGIYVSIIIGCIFMLIGSWVRVFIYFEDNFFYILLGSILNGIGRPFILNC